MNENIEKEKQPQIGSGNLWYKKTKDGRMYMSGHIFIENPDGSLKKLHINVFQNDYKSNGGFFRSKDKTPDCTVIIHPYKEEKEEKESSVPL